jgi:hypothetical protein
MIFFFFGILQWMKGGMTKKKVFFFCCINAAPFLLFAAFDFEIFFSLPEKVLIVVIATTVIKGIKYAAPAAQISIFFLKIGLFFGWI